MAAVLERPPVANDETHTSDAATLIQSQDGAAHETGDTVANVNCPIRFADIGSAVGGDQQGGDDAAPLKVESLCMECRQNGTTTIFFTRIPHFREVVIMAFECPHCGCRNNEVQPASVIQDRGCRLTLSINKGDIAALSRQVVKSETATLTVPELEFEIPPNTQKGILSTVEGMLTQAVTNLQLLQVHQVQVQLLL